MVLASEFWAWFAANAPALGRVDQDRDGVLDALHEKLAAYDDGLYPVVGEGADGAREFIVTAGGDVDRFAAAEALVNAAPHVAGWTFAALKPPLGFDFEIEFEGVLFDPRTMRFDPLEGVGHPEATGVRVYVPNFEDAGADRVSRAVAVILDTALGERSYAADVRHVEVAPLVDDADEPESLPLTDLPAYIEFTRRGRRPADR